MCSLDDLDDVCILCIISHIRNVRERIRLKRVSRRFSSLVDAHCSTNKLKLLDTQDIYYPLEQISPYAYDRSSLFLNQVLIYFPRIHSLNLSLFNDISINFNRIKCLNNLNFLKINGPLEIKENLNPLLSLCTNLKHFLVDNFDLSYCNINNINSKLISISLKGYRSCFIALEMYLKSKGSDLIYLCLNSHLLPKNLGIDLLKILSSYCQNLEYLETNFKPHNYFHLRRFRNLRVLKLSSIANPCNLEDFKSFLSSNPKLEEFHINLEISDNDIFKKVLSTYGFSSNVKSVDLPFRHPAFHLITDDGFKTFDSLIKYI